MTGRLLALGLVFLFAAAPPLQRPTAARAQGASDLVRVPWERVAGDLVDDLDATSLAAAAAQSALHFGRRPAEERLRIADRSCTAGKVRSSLAEFRRRVATGEPAESAARKLFRLYRSDGRPGGPLITGYYEPLLEGRRHRQDGFVYPLYRRPSDLVEVPLERLPDAEASRPAWGRVANGKLSPYFSRREIDSRGALAGLGLELVWLDDPIERFFLHVQGSGVIDLGHGKRMRVGYAGSNGRPYTSIGKLLRNAGFLGDGQATAPAIRRWLRAHPELRDDVLYANERYIFFREVSDGPIGSLNVPLTAGRSVAADPGAYPPGLVAYLDARTPEVDESGEQTGYAPLRRFVVIQDTGAAITGPGRIDLFYGTGHDAGARAGLMSETGTLYVLSPC